MTYIMVAVEKDEDNACGRRKREHTSIRKAIRENITPSCFVANFVLLFLTAPVAITTVRKRHLYGGSTLTEATSQSRRRLDYS